MTTRQLVLRTGRALSGPDLAEVPDALVVLDGTTIGDIGPRDRTRPPRDATEMELSELTLLPGFIDAHVHIGFYPPAEVAEGGVTTVRDLAWPPEQIFPLAERSRSEEFHGPAIFAVGPMLTVPGGYPLHAPWAPPGTGVPLETPEQATDAVEAAAAAGACAIKVGLDPHVGPTLDLPLLRQVVDAAHRRGLKVTAHVYGLDELDKAIEAGIDELAHMLMSTETIPDDVLDRMISQGIAIVPTLSCRSGRDLEVAIDNLRRFVVAGGRVVYGTDLGNEGPRPGIEALELAAMAAAGMDPRAIVRSATVDSADWLGLDDRGVLAPGMRADLIGVRGDPLADLDALDKVELVIRCGRVLRRPVTGS